MLAQVSLPTETRKNGPATSPANTPARRNGFAFIGASVVLPATSQSYGDARGTVKGDHQCGSVGAAGVHSDWKRRGVEFWAGPSVFRSLARPGRLGGSGQLIEPVDVLVECIEHGPELHLRHLGEHPDIFDVLERRVLAAS